MIRHRRLVMRLMVCVAVLTTLTCVPGAMALVAVVDAVAVVDPAAIDTTATVAPTVTATPVAEPALAPAPVAVAPVAVAPPPLVDPVAVATPAPTPAAQATPDQTVPSAVTQPTPAAPQEIIFMVVQEASAVVAGANAAPAITPVAPIAPSADQVDLSTLAVAAVVVGSTLTPLKVAPEPSAITPLVVPIVQGLGAGLLLPFVSPKTFGPPPPSFGRVVEVPTAVAQPMRTHPPVQATPVAADLPFGFAAPPGGWTGEGAGILALLMGFLPLGVPDGKSSLTQQTQAALILIGALLMVLPFFASPLRDRRRRGPRGFATLALRPG